MGIPDELDALLSEKPMGHIASVKPDGQPHLVPVWIGYDGEHFLVAGRPNKQRHTNVKHEPRVALTVIDLSNPYSRSFSIQGETESLTPDGALEFLNQMSRQYFDIDEHPITDSDRLLMRIRPTKIIDTSVDFDMAETESS
ncbi:TIGR03618 family F420-dependent PPOX class oxidoreductase [Haloferax sp. AB510]|uniref:TIGR03618 family F420-dependent PPOX class oxidoreductase n=1 Tax=Haloferax sp. AB510 TaxID=2934172 RepID=UPI00209C3BB7|nr:TIGR03618 family F420-dependent PPOX class oxidoreductase [Haloferax sp. AB510]MCO8267155.1 TIGR03618 family F420-dependent PPOX class oxidoreductase [Haloferax sp. AB510]